MNGTWWYEKDFNLQAEAGSPQKNQQKPVCTGSQLRV